MAVHKNATFKNLEQWDNLKEYFINYLSKTDTFKSKVKDTKRYKRILDFLKCPTSKASLCFITYIAHEFEDYLIKMQSNEPMIHTMFDKMSSLLYNLMRKFLIRSSVTETIKGQTRPKHGTNLISVDLDKSQMDLDLIDIGTKSKNLLNSSTVSKDLKKDFLKVFVILYHSYQIFDIKTSLVKQIIN